MVLAADVVTNMDVHYLPQRGDVLEATFPVVPGTGVMVIPASLTTLGVINILDANAVEATSTGRKIVLTPATAAPAAGNVQLDVPKANVRFAVADAVVRATVKFSLVPPTAERLDAALELASDIY